ncbi:MAG: hypothetical protein AAGA48_27360 [Myxococcota bacterium]
MFSLAIVWIACQPADELDPNRPEVVYEPASSSFWDQAWPSDERLDPDGTLAVRNFPNVGGGVLGAYIDRADQQVGYATNAPIYVPLTGPVDPLAMPAPFDGTASSASLTLIDIDPTSAYFGEQRPIQWEQTTFEKSDYQPQHLLAVAPWPGYPLRPSTTYALVLSQQAVKRHPEWATRLSSDASDHDANLVRALQRTGWTTDNIAFATVFTTMDPIGELASIADIVQRRLPPADLDAVPLRQLEGRAQYTAYVTEYLSPVFTEGEPPFLSEGGNFRIGEDGVPVVTAWDRMRTAVCVPHGEPPEGGWPVVIYQHGTGGNYRTFCNSDRALEVMNRLGARGIVGIGIDQTLHGTRPGSDNASDLAHFNVTNPDSGVTNFRQGAVDLLYLARSLANRPQRWSTDDGRVVVTDPDRILFMGHSQGGLTGALAGPFVGADLKAMVLSGTGAVLAITLVERKDPLDFEQFVRVLANLAPEEPMTPLHPVLALVQTLVEPTDPANYARYWFAEPGWWDGQRSVPVLVTSGTADAATPFRTAIALATAAHVPFVGLPATRAEGLRARVGEPQDLPVRDNAQGFDGRTITAGFHQWLGGGHGVLFQNADAADVYVNFLETAAFGEPELIGPR